MVRPCGGLSMSWRDDPRLLRDWVKAPGALVPGGHFLGGS